MGKGSNTTTTTSSQPPQAVLDAYQDAYSRAQGAASQGYQPYGGPTVAPLTSQQRAAIGLAKNSAADFQPYNNAAESLLGQATTPLWSEVSSFMSPYIQNVVNATQAQFNNQNAIQQQGVVGNAVSQNAWGGDRSAVAQGIVAGQQQLAQAPVIANLYNQGYNTALSGAEAQNYLAAGAAGQYANLGQLNFGMDQATLDQMMKFGTIEQQQNQADLNVPYYQYQAGQAYPFQTAGFLANIAEGLGSGAGGTSSTTSPGPSPVSQVAGLGIGAAGLVGATGGFGSNGWLTNLFKADGGRIPTYADGGGLPYGTGRPMDDPINFNIPDLSIGIVPSGPPPGHGNSSFSPMGSPTTTSSSSGGGGILGTLGDIAGIAKAAATIAALRDGGPVHGYDDGGAVFGDIPYQPQPMSGRPLMGISIVPQMRPMSRGIGPPRPPAAQSNQGVDTSPMGLLKLGQASGAFGKNGWLTGNSGNGIVPTQQQAMYGLAAPGGPMDGIQDASGTQYDPAIMNRLARGGIVGYDNGGIVATADIPPAPIDWNSLQALTSAQRRTLPRDAMIDAIVRHYNLGPTGYRDAGQFADEWSLFDNAPELEPGFYSNGQYKRGGGIVPHYDDGGDIVATADLPPLIVTPDPKFSSGLAPFADAPDTSLSSVPDDLRAGIVPDKPAPVMYGNGQTNGIMPVDNGEPGRDGVVQFWMNQGVPAHVAQGIADRVGAESGFNSGIMGDGNTSGGYYQHHADRLANLKAFAADHGASWADPNIQNQFALNEVLGGDPVAAAHWQEIQNAPDRATAAKLWDRYFERSAAGPGSSAPMAVASRGATDGYGPSSTPSMGIAPSAGGDDAVNAGIVPRATTISKDSLDSLKQPGVNPWMALAAAGFAMAGGRSPFALQNIGAGALEGVKLLEQQRQSLPEVRLKNAQADLAEVEVSRQKAFRDFLAGKSPASAGVPHLTATVDAARQSISGTGETQALPAPGGSVAPIATAQNPSPVTSPAQGQTGAPTAGVHVPPVTPEEQKLSQELRAQIADIDHRVALQQQFLPFSKSPEDYNKAQASINSLVIRRSELIERLPEYIRSKAFGTKAAEQGFEFHSARPGSYAGFGTNLQGTPELKEVVNPVDGTRSMQWITPPPLNGPQSSPATSAASGQGAVTALGPAQHAELEGRGTEAKNEREAILKDAQSAQNQDAILTNMDANADKFWTGKFSDFVGDAKAYLRVINPAHNDSVASREQFVKDAGNLTRTATRELSSRAAYQEVQFIQNTLPNPEMSPVGIHRVVNELRGLNDYKVAKAQALSTWMGTHNNSALGFEDNWQSNAPVTPYTFVVARMAQPERQELFAKWNQTAAGRAELQRMRSQMATAAQSGWLR